MTINLHHQANTFNAIKDIVTSNTTGGLYAISGMNRDIRHAHIPIVVMTIFVTSVRRILQLVISITKPYSVLTSSHCQLPTCQSQTTTTPPKPLMPTVHHGH